MVGTFRDIDVQSCPLGMFNVIDEIRCSCVRVNYREPKLLAKYTPRAVAPRDVFALLRGKYIDNGLEFIISIVFLGFMGDKSP